MPNISYQVNFPKMDSILGGNSTYNKNKIKLDIWMQKIDLILRWIKTYDLSSIQYFLVNNIFVFDETFYLI